MTRQRCHNYHPDQFSQQFSQHYTAHPYGSGQAQAGVIPPPYGASTTIPRPRATGYGAGSMAPLPLGNPQGRRPQRSRRRRPQNLWLAGGVAGGSFLALTTLLINPSTDGNTKPISFECQQTVQPQAVLSRDVLSTLLAIPERASREAVREVVAEPYCVLSPVEVRAGVLAEREVYPLAFDPQTWFIVLYEEGEYAGYDFSFRRD